MSLMIPAGLRFRSLASGSAGNATLVEAYHSITGECCRILIDCGLKIRQLELRLLEEGLDISDIHAIFLTHEHSDHIGCVLTIVKKWQIPVWSSSGTWNALDASHLGDLWHIARDGQVIDWGFVQAFPFTVPHDASEPLHLRVCHAGKELAVITDLGFITDHVREYAQGCQALLLEFNHDLQMLERSTYPTFLKRRISGSYGHLSNEAAEQFLRHIVHDKLQAVVAGHLSQQNNDTKHVLQRLECVAAELQPTMSVNVATQNAGCSWIDVKD